MSYIERHAVSVTTDASGDATEYSPVITGKIANIIYAKTDFDAGVDFTITLEATGQTLWTESNVDASKTVAPRQKVHDDGGTSIIRAMDGGEAEDDIVCANDRVKIVVANGGNTKTGTFNIVVH